MSDTADLFAHDVQPSAADGIQMTDPDEVLVRRSVSCEVSMKDAMLMSVADPLNAPCIIETSISSSEACCKTSVTNQLHLLCLCLVTGHCSDCMRAHTLPQPYLAR